MKRLIICLLAALSVAVVQPGAAHGATSDPVGPIVDSFHKKNGPAARAGGGCPDTPRLFQKTRKNGFRRSPAGRRTT